MSVVSYKTDGSSGISIFQCEGCNQSTKGKLVNGHDMILYFCCATKCGHASADGDGWYGCFICQEVQPGRARLGNKYSVQRHLERNQKHQKAAESFRTARAKMAAQERKTQEQRRMEDQHNSTVVARCLAFAYFPQDGLFGEYFRYQVATGNCGVIGLLIGSNFKNFDHSRDTLRRDEAMLDFNQVRLHLKLSRLLSAEVALIIHSAYLLGKQHQIEDSSGTVSGNRRIIPPLDFNDVRRRYTEGKRSVYQSLPIPDVHKLIDEHSYSSILDCGTVALANGIGLAHISSDLREEQLSNSYRYLWETPRAAEIATEARRAGIPADTRIIFYILWRDDVEANWTKGNKGSVWLFTLSFIGVGAHSRSKSCTFSLAVGKSKTPHTEVERIVHDTMRREAAQPHMLYCGTTKAKQKVAFFPLLISTDSPKKRKATGTTMGSGLYHARFRCSADHYRLLPIIRACDDCLGEMRAGQLPGKCKACANWDVLDVEPDVQEMLKLQATGKYPRTHLENEHGIRYLTEDGCLVPFEITFARLRASHQLAFDNFANFRWTKKQVEEFLSVECINGKLTEEVIENGINARIIGAINNGTSKYDEEMRELFLIDVEHEPEAYACPPVPPIWLGDDDISLFVDAPMHLIFLGIVKSSLNSIKKWLAKQGRLTDFFDRCKFLNGLLDDVHIDWLRIEDFREGKFGGWVSENFVAFSRIMLWFFQDVGSLVREEVVGEDSVPPSASPNSKWRAKHFVRWLYDRDVKFSGTIVEMKVKIIALLNRPEGPPPVVERSGIYAPEPIERVLLALDAMITVLMTDEVDPEVTCPLAELRVKHFLTEFDLLTQSYQDERKKPKVITASNYLTLVNLPNMMRRFGPLREFWEGMFCGEGFVRCLKPYLRYGQRCNFAVNAMTHCHRESALEMATDHLNGKLDQTEAKAPGRAKTGHWQDLLLKSRDSFSTYDSRKEVTDRLFGQKVVSTVVFLPRKENSIGGLRDVHVYVVSRCKSTDENPDVRFQLYGLQKDLEQISTKLTMRYYGWQLAPSPMDWGQFPKMYPPPDFEMTFGCLLPMLCDTGDSLHMLICKDRSIYS